MDCRHCGTKMEGSQIRHISFEQTIRILKCPTCKRRAETCEKVTKWLPPTFIDARK